MLSPRPWAGTALSLLLCGIAAAQAPTPAPTPARPASLTLAQVVARQQANYARIRTAMGQVSWTEQRAGTQQATTAAPDKRVIYFALEPERSTNLVLPAKSAGSYVQGQGRIDWSQVLSAVAIDKDTVYSIAKPPNSNAPEVRVAPLNPAVHEANPLVSFHPRILGDERVTLVQLAASAPQMAAPPRLSEVNHRGTQAVRIDFQNPAKPGESVYYIVDPAKACLALEIGRISGGRLASRTQITIGSTKDGTWIPARREKQTLDEAGRVIAQEGWYYNYLAVNEGVTRRGATLAFFNLPEGTRYFGPNGKPLAPPSRP